MCGWRYMVHLTLFCLLFIKMEKLQSMTYTKIKLYIILILHFFPRMNNKKVTKRGGQGGPTQFFLKELWYGSSN